jgi:hypothetical protein
MWSSIYQPRRSRRVDRVDRVALEHATSASIYRSCDTKNLGISNSHLAQIDWPLSFLLTHLPVEWMNVVWLSKISFRNCFAGEDL